MAVTSAALLAAAAVVSVVATGADAGTHSVSTRHGTTAGPTASTVAGTVTGTVATRADQRSPDPAAFAAPVANPWFPLVPGTTTILRGTEDGEHFRERVRVIGGTKLIEGVATVPVRDVLRRGDGTVAERTTDWYAADDRGNVWYFGERTATFDASGRLESREGTWRAGVRGASAGLIMPAGPHATQAYRQEFRKGHAEDQAWIVGFRRSVSTPMRRFHHVLRTFEWTRLEPGVVSIKLYARGVGIVRERDIAGGKESFEVVAVRRP